MTHHARKVSPFRVQIPAYTDRWMMGDRYGAVQAEREYSKRGTSNTQWQVLLDKSNKLVWVRADDCTVV